MYAFQSSLEFWLLEMAKEDLGEQGEGEPDQLALRRWESFRHLTAQQRLHPLVWREGWGDGENRKKYRGYCWAFTSRRYQFMKKRHEFRSMKMRHGFYKIAN